jgi:uncharacterized protein (TIGR03435 family)
MVDLIRNAYNVDDDKVLGGPSWLEWDRFDIVAQAPPKTSQDRLRLMLRSLLADRFKLVFHNDSHALPTYALSVGKDGQKLMRAEAGQDSGCKMTVQQNDAQRVQAAIQNGGPVKLNLATFLYSCHGMTMEAFAGQMNTMLVAQSYITKNPVVDRTGLTGAYDFDFKYTQKPPTQLPMLNGAQVTMNGTPISLFDAMEKQLGLKLDPVTAPIPVILVDSVNRTPAANPPDVAAKLPPRPPAEFEVAEVRLTPPEEKTENGRVNGNQLNLRDYPLKQLISMGWRLGNTDSIDAPKWVDDARVDVIAKLPARDDGSQGVNTNDLYAALQTLLKDRFKIAEHTEMRPATAWTLKASKPKLATADPASRTYCKTESAAEAKDGKPNNSVAGVALICQNVTMAQLADLLPDRASGYFRTSDPVADETGLTGSYDFTLRYSSPELIPGTPIYEALSNALSRVGAAAAAGAANDDPTGAVSLMDALSKLGLKLEQEKRPVPMLVLDHIELPAPE